MKLREVLMFLIQAFGVISRAQILKHFKLLLELRFLSLVVENHSMLSIGLGPVITYYGLHFAGPGENRYQ